MMSMIDLNDSIQYLNETEEVKTAATKKRPQEDVERQDFNRNLKKYEASMSSSEVLARVLALLIVTLGFFTAGLLVGYFFRPDEVPHYALGGGRGICTFSGIVNGSLILSVKDGKLHAKFTEPILQISASGGPYSIALFDSANITDNCGDLVKNGKTLAFRSHAEENRKPTALLSEVYLPMSYSSSLTFDHEKTDLIHGIDLLGRSLAIVHERKGALESKGVIQSPLSCCVIGRYS